MISPGIDRDRITPEWLTKLTEPIEALYTALQHDLIVNIARQFNVFGRKANIPTSYAWRGYMLGQLGGLTKENYDTIARYSGDISEATRLAVQTSVEASVGVVDRAFMEEVLDPDYAPEITETTERVTGYYVNQALEKQNLVNTVMLNSTRRYYEQAVGATSDALDQSLDAAQQALNAAAGGVIHGTTDFYSALRDCVRDMADHGLTGFYDKAGREWSAQAYVTMDMRTTAANAAREAAMERNREYGNELIAVSSHPGARPLCEPYQGGVYSTDGSTGETTDVHGASISYYPLELTSYGEAAGLFGINCGHYPSPFIPGLSVVRKLDISHEENERLYKESQRQRYMERRVRAAKIEADALKAAGDAEGAKAARAKARERNAELKAWCKERERAYYPEKVRVTRGEKAESVPLTSSMPDATMRMMSVEGSRNTEPLTEEQIEKAINYAVSLGMPRDGIEYIQSQHTYYVYFKETLDGPCEKLIIGPDLFPNPNGSRANDLISWKGALAHEIIGHRATCLRGTAGEPNTVFDEAQASIRASKFTPDLDESDRALLLQDAKDRIRNAGFDFESFIKDMDIREA